MVGRFLLLLTSISMLAGYNVANAPVAAAGESSMYLAVDGYAWKEFDDDGSRLLKESGTLIGVGYAYRKEFDNQVTLNPAAEIFGGKVDYDGQTQSGIPATSKVNYFGVKLQGDVGRKFKPAQGAFAEPFGGLGFRAWIRDIQDGTTSTGLATYGYTEDWLTLYARLGVRGGFDFPGRTQVFAEAGIKLPLYNENTAHLSDAGLGSDVTFNPGRKSSLFAETGVNVRHFRASLFYDSMRFTKSNVVVTSNGGITYLNWQPKSSADIYGIKLGYVF